MNAGGGDGHPHVIERLVCNGFPAVYRFWRQITVTTVCVVTIVPIMVVTSITINRFVSISVVYPGKPKILTLGPDSSVQGMDA